MMTPEAGARSWLQVLQRSESRDHFCVSRRSRELCPQV